jgi:hypothetical protein
MCWRLLSALPTFAKNAAAVSRQVAVRKPRHSGLEIVGQPFEIARSPGTRPRTACRLGNALQCRMASAQTDWTPDKVLDAAQKCVEAGALTESGALGLLEHLPFEVLGWTLEELAVRDSQDAAPDDVPHSGSVDEEVETLAKLMEKLVKLSANCAQVRRYLPLGQLLDLIRLGLYSRHVLVRTVTLRLLCLILNRKEMPEEFCLVAADTIIERFDAGRDEDALQPNAALPTTDSVSPSTPRSTDSDLLLRLLKVFRDDDSIQVAALCERALKQLVELKPLRGAVALLHDRRSSHILVQEMLAGEAGSVALIRALNLLLGLCDHSSVVEIAARRLLPSVLVQRVAARVHIDEDMLLRLNLLDILGTFMQHSAVAAELLDQVAVFDTLLRQHLLFLLTPSESPPEELMQRWFLWMCAILRFMRTSAGSNRCAFYGWIDEPLVELLGRFLLLYVVEEGFRDQHWVQRLDIVRRMTLLGHLIAAVGSLGLCDRGIDVLLADVDTMKLVLRFVRSASVSEVRTAALQALCTFLSGVDAPLDHQSSLAHCSENTDLEVRQQRVLHLFADALREVDLSGTPIDALMVVLECARHPAEEERLAALSVFRALALSRLGLVALSSLSGFVEMLSDTSDSSVTVLESMRSIAKCLAEQHAADGGLVFGPAKWSRVMAIASGGIRETPSRQGSASVVNTATMNQ